MKNVMSSFVDALAHLHLKVTQGLRVRGAHCLLIVAMTSVLSNDVCSFDIVQGIAHRDIKPGAWSD